MAEEDHAKPLRIGCYEIQDKILGKGNFATVYLAVHRIVGNKVALKVTNRDYIKEEYVSRNLGREAHILSKLTHPNIIHLYETITCKRFYCISLELVRGEDLSQYLKKQVRFRVSEKVAKMLFYQMVSAIFYMHRQQILHRDLKPENILVEHNRVIKIVDFGFSNVYAPYTRVRTHCGSVEYAAPELFGHIYGREVDMWSLGVILYTMLIGTSPFTFSEEIIMQSIKYEQSRIMLIKRILQGLTEENWECMQFLSCECKNLLEKLLQIDPFLRLSAGEAIKHVWFTDTDLRKRLPKERLDLQKKFHAEVVEYLAYKLCVPKERVRRHIATTKLSHITAMYAIVHDTLMKEILFPIKDFKHSFLYKFTCWKKALKSDRLEEKYEVNEHGDGLKQLGEPELKQRLTEIGNSCQSDNAKKLDVTVLPEDMVKIHSVQENDNLTDECSQEHLVTRQRIEQITAFSPEFRLFQSEKQLNSFDKPQSCRPNAVVGNCKITDGLKELEEPELTGQLLKFEDSCLSETTKKLEPPDISEKVVKPRSLHTKVNVRDEHKQEYFINSQSAVQRTVFDPGHKPFRTNKQLNSFGKLQSGRTSELGKRAEPMNTMTVIEASEEPKFSLQLKKIKYNCPSDTTKNLSLPVPCAKVINSQITDAKINLKEDFMEENMVNSKIDELEALFNPEFQSFLSNKQLNSFKKPINSTNCSILRPISRQTRIQSYRSIPRGKYRYRMSASEIQLLSFDLVNVSEKSENSLLCTSNIRKSKSNEFNYLNGSTFNSKVSLMKEVPSYLPNKNVKNFTMSKKSRHLLLPNTSSNKSGKQNIINKNTQSSEMRSRIGSQIKSKKRKSLSKVQEIKNKSTVNYEEPKTELEDTDRNSNSQVNFAENHKREAFVKDIPTENFISFRLKRQSECKQIQVVGQKTTKVNHAAPSKIPTIKTRYRSRQLCPSSKIHNPPIADVCQFTHLCCAIARSQMKKKRN